MTAETRARPAGGRPGDRAARVVAAGAEKPLAPGKESPCETVSNFARGSAKRPAHVTRERWQRGDVAVEDHADPDRPQRDQNGVQVGYHSVRGARAAQGGHDYLHRRGSIDVAQHRAASRYADAWREAGRCGCVMGGAGEVKIPPHQQGHPSFEMLRAAETLRQAEARLSRREVEMVHRVTIQEHTLGRIGGDWRESDQATLGRLRGALDRLAEMWRLEGA